MSDSRNPYNQAPVGQEMPMQPPMPMQQRLAIRANRNKDVIPKWLTQHSVVVYLLALAIVSFMYSAHSMPWYYLLSGVISVSLFFLYGSYLTKDLAVEKIRKEKKFEKKIFGVAFIPRVLWMLLIYFIFQGTYGDTFGFENGDAPYYHSLGGKVAELINEGNFNFYEEIYKWSGHDDISDMGYGIYLGFISWLTDGNVIVVRLLKCLWSSLTVLLVFRITKRNFGEQTARIAAIFVALWPNFWYYCGTHLKETEMVFLEVLFIDQAEQMLRSRQFTAWKVIPILLIAALIFTFRTPLGLVAILALVFSVVMSSSKVVNWGKRVIIGGLAIALIGVAAGNVIQEKTQELFKVAQSDDQHKNMEWRGTREHGNSFAKYAGKSVFAPLIFTIPFPSMVRPFDGQEQQQLLNGGNFCKNIISGFTILALVMLLISGKWRDHLLPLSFMLGYLVVLTVSAFAQSERFHQPAVPLEMMFAAYGLSIALTKPKYKRWFTYWSALIFVACVAWNWFKMAGRGL